MDIIHEIVVLIEFLVGAAVVSGVLLIASLVAISLLPKDNVIHRLLVALTKRIGLMLGVSVAAAPLAMLPVFGELADFAGLCVTVWYWGKLFWECRDILDDARIERQTRPVSRPTIPVSKAPDEERLLLSSTTRQREDA